MNRGRHNAVIGGMSDKMTGKLEGFQTEHNGVKAATSFIDVARGACRTIGVSSKIPLRQTFTRETISPHEVKTVDLVRRLQTRAQQL